MATQIPLEKSKTIEQGNSSMSGRVENLTWSTADSASGYYGLNKTFLVL